MSNRASCFAHKPPKRQNKLSGGRSSQSQGPRWATGDFRAKAGRCTPYHLLLSSKSMMNQSARANRRYDPCFPHKLSCQAGDDYQVVQHNKLCDGAAAPHIGVDRDGVVISSSLVASLRKRCSYPPARPVAFRNVARRPYASRMDDLIGVKRIACVAGCGK